MPAVKNLTDSWEQVLPERYVQGHKIRCMITSLLADLILNTSDRPFSFLPTLCNFVVIFYTEIRL